MLTINRSRQKRLRVHPDLLYILLRLRVPLTALVGSSDLGDSAQSVDAALQSVFDIAATWKAIVLIDEVCIAGSSLVSGLMIIAGRCLLGTAFLA